MPVIQPLLPDAPDIQLCALICEYNPFHTGHAMQLAMLRQAVPNAVILAVMSGNFVQRAEPAHFPAVLRAKAAILHGVDLVVTLLLPFSLTPATQFARAGVQVAAHMGAQLLFFGAETPDIQRLSTVSHRLHAADFEAKLRASLIDSHDGVGYAARRQALYQSLYGDADRDILCAPNNILALEYLHYTAQYHLRTLVFPRIAAQHDASALYTATDGQTVCSATALRAALRCADKDKVLSGCPDDCAKLYTVWQRSGFAAEPTRADSALLFCLSGMDAQELESYADIPHGMGARLQQAAYTANSMQEFLKRAAHKKYTAAHLRRMCLCAAFGIPKDMPTQDVGYVRLEAATARGLSYLHHAKARIHIPVLSKEAHIRLLPAQAQAQHTVTSRADRFYRLLFPTPLPALRLQRDEGGNLWYHPNPDACAATKQ